MAASGTLTRPCHSPRPLSDRAAFVMGYCMCRGGVRLLQSMAPPTEGVHRGGRTWSAFIVESRLRRGGWPSSRKHRPPGRPKQRCGARAAKLAAAAHKTVKTRLAPWRALPACAHARPPPWLALRFAPGAGPVAQAAGRRRCAAPVDRAARSRSCVRAPRAKAWPPPRAGAAPRHAWSKGRAR
jgi:hypothetical protein